MINQDYLNQYIGGINHLLTKTFLRFCDMKLTSVDLRRFCHSDLIRF
jgi:hypothetical protein